MALRPTEQLLDWKAPEHWLRLHAIDAHTGGEPLRIFLSGFPELKGSSILAQQSHCRDNFDFLRTATMWEPRGHADMYGCIVTPPTRKNSDFGVIFTHNEGYSSMCGHGIIAVTKVVLETGLMAITSPRTTLRIDTPAGQVTAHAEIENGLVDKLSFHNVPAYVVELDASVMVSGLGEVRYDLAFGGAYYAFVNAPQLGISTAQDNTNELIAQGRAIKKAVMASRSITHPFDPELGFLYGTIFIDAPQNPNADSRNVCIFADGELDRSPTGTGVSARAAIHHARGELNIRESLLIESIIGSTFRICITEVTRFGPYDAVIPEVEGEAYITGKHEFLIDPSDPLKHGFLLR